MAQLDQIDTLFQTTEAREGFGDVPDGNYQVRIEKAWIGNAKSSGRLQASIEASILNTQYRGSKLWTHMGLADEDSIARFKGTMAKLGLEMKTAREIPGMLDSLMGTYALFSVKTKGTAAEIANGTASTWTNVQKALDEKELDEPVEYATGEPAAAPAEEVPAEEPAVEEVAAEEPAVEEVAAEEPVAEPEAEADVPPQVVNITGPATSAQVAPYKVWLTAKSKSIGINPADYGDETLNLLLDTAEASGVVGDFPTIVALVNAVKAKK